MATQIHRIRRYVLDLQVSGSGEGLRLRSEAERWQKEAWLPLLESVLDDFSDSEETIVLDRLDIELEDLHVHDWQQAATAQLKQKLEAALRRSLQSVSVNRHPAERRSLDALAHYLRTGALPWWAPQDFSSAPGDWIRQWVEKISPKALNDLARPLLFSSGARMRLAAELSEGPFWKLARALSDTAESRLWHREYDFCNDLVKGARQASDQFCVQCRAAILGASLHMREPAKAAAYLAKELLPLITPGVEAILHDHLTELLRPAAPASDAQAASHAAQEFLRNILSADALLFADEQVEEEVRDESHTHYLPDAGLIILAPFLPRFFERIGVVREGKLVDGAKAVVALYFLGSGEETYGEWQLLFPKILCGLPIATVIPSGTVVLSLEEKEEAVTLLHSVIELWAVLKNTSVEGLRASFLQRQGRLTEKEAPGAWRLLVQPRAHDLLLQHLPWTISIVRLPWMKAPLFVDWT